MNLSKIHHIAIIVSDYEAAKNFYVNKLGFSVIRENYRPERKDWKLDLRVNEHTELEIFAEENPPKRVNRPEACGLRHLAFCVDITAGVYESDTAMLVRQTFHSFRETQDYSTAVTSTMSALQLSRPSVTSYLPYEKGVYFSEDADAANISTGAERQRHYRAVVALKKNPCEENLWKCVVAFRGYEFKTLSGLPFTYKLKKGRGDEFTKEL